tara:strand:+ start:1885 stop:1995 length:111 start_codon:yes stop_codon:yes gene_type:complete
LTSATLLQVLRGFHSNFEINNIIILFCQINFIDLFD